MNNCGGRAYVQTFLHTLWVAYDMGNSRTAEVAISSSLPTSIQYLNEYAEEKSIYMKINYVNMDHVHALIDLPTHLSIEDVFQLFKGSSSHWINQNDLISGKFSWGRGYAGFSVSHSNVSAVAKYIANQEEHHRRKSFQEEYKQLMDKHGLVVYGKDGVEENR